MTITVTEDLINGYSFGLTPNGPVATRVFYAVADAGEKAGEVLQAPGIPQYFDMHPESGGSTGYFSIFALEITCQPIEQQPGQYIITANYSRPDATQQIPSTAAEDSIIQVGSSVSSGKTQKDKNGDQIVVSLTGQPDQVGDVEIQLPETVVLFERKESASPLAKSVSYTGTVNDAEIVGADVTYAARTLLCLGIDGTSTDNGQTWTVTYRFQYKPDTWDAEIVYIDPETDRPHDDINIATNDGYKVVSVYPESVFSTLNLNW